VGFPAFFRFWWKTPGVDGIIPMGPETEGARGEIQTDYQENAFARNPGILLPDMANPGKTVKIILQLEKHCIIISL